MPCLSILILLGIGSRAAAQVETVLLPTAREQMTEWKYTTTPPALEWLDAGFEAQGWQAGLGGFGTEGTPGAIIGTVWDSSEIWLLKTFSLANAANLENPAFKVHHDETVEIYLNGVLVALADGYTTEYITLPLSDVAKGALKDGDNTLAIHCSQTIGGQYIDVGMVTVKTLELVPLLPTSSMTQQEWNYTEIEPGTSNWMAPGFSAEGWSTGLGGFGTVMSGMDPVPTGTPWVSSNIWLRKTFSVPDKAYTDFFFNIFYDEDVEVFLNGTLVLSKTGYVTGFKQEAMSREFNALIVPGENLVAVHCRQTTGGQYIDLGISAVESEPTSIGKSGGPDSSPRYHASRARIARGRRGGLGISPAGSGPAGRFDFNGKRIAKP